MNLGSVVCRPQVHKTCSSTQKNTHQQNIDQWRELCNWSIWQVRIPEQTTGFTNLRGPSYEIIFTNVFTSICLAGENWLTILLNRLLYKWTICLADAYCFKILLSRLLALLNNLSGWYILFDNFIEQKATFVKTLSGWWIL